MSFVTFTTTQLSDVSQMMKIQSDDNDQMDVLQWNPTTNVLTSPSGRIPQAMLTAIQARLDQLRATVAPADYPNMQYALGMCCAFSDMTGVVSPLGVEDGTTSTIRLVGFLPNQAAYVVAAVPHSITPYQISTPQ